MIGPNALDWICDRMVAFWASVFGPRQIREETTTTANAEQATTEINPMVSPNRLDLLFNYGPRAFFVGRPVGEKKVYPTTAPRRPTVNQEPAPRPAPPRTAPLTNPPKPAKAKADETAREANAEATRIRAEAQAADKAAKAQTAETLRNAKREATRIRDEALSADKVAEAQAEAEASARRREAKVKAAEAKAAQKLAEAQAEAEEIAKQREAANIKANLPKPLPRLKPQRWWQLRRQTLPPPPPPAETPSTSEAPPPAATAIPPETATFEHEEDHTDPHGKAEDPQIPHGASGLIRLGALGELRPLAAPNNPLEGPNGSEHPPVEEVHSLLDLRSSIEAREANQPKPPAAPPPLPRQTLPETTTPLTTEVQPMRRITTEELPAISSPPLVVGPPSLTPATEAADRLISKTERAAMLREVGFLDEPEDEDHPAKSGEILKMVDDHLNPPMSAEELARDPQVLEDYEKAFGVPHSGSGPQRVEQPTAQQFALGSEDSGPLPFETDNVEIEDEEPQTPTPPSPPPPPEEDLSGLLELEEIHDPSAPPPLPETPPTTEDDSAELAAMNASLRSNSSLLGFFVSLGYGVATIATVMMHFEVSEWQWWHYAITVSLFIPPTIIAIVLLRRRRKQLAAA